MKHREGVPARKSLVWSTRNKKLISRKSFLQLEGLSFQLGPPIEFDFVEAVQYYCEQSLFEATLELLLSYYPARSHYRVIQEEQQVPCLHRIHLTEFDE